MKKTLLLLTALLLSFSTAVYATAEEAPKTHNIQVTGENYLTITAKNKEKITEGCMFALNYFTYNVSAISENMVKKQIYDATGRKIKSFKQLCTDNGFRVASLIIKHPKNPPSHSSNWIDVLSSGHQTPDKFDYPNNKCMYTNEKGKLVETEKRGGCLMGALYYTTQQPDMYKRIGFMAGGSIILNAAKVYSLGKQFHKDLDLCTDPKSIMFWDCTVNYGLMSYNAYQIATGQKPRPGEQKEPSTAVRPPTENPPPPISNTNKEFDSMLSQATQGDKFAQLVVGHMYEEGIGVAKSDHEAIKWYTRAAEQKLPKAQFLLGTMYEKGQGIQKDYIESFKWYYRAAEQGYGAAQVSVAEAYVYGKGVPKDQYKEAIKWLEKAANQGVPGARDAVNHLKGVLAKQK